MTVKNDMIISQNKPYQQPTFTSRSLEIKKAGDVCRRVMNEFPIVNSYTRIFKFGSRTKNKSLDKLEDYLSVLTDKFRDYYDVDNLTKYFSREILGLKKHKIGNCHEIADATYMALKVNGYEDVKPLWLYAYNPKRKIMRDLDHVVIGINFKTPDGYKYKDGDPIFMSPKHRIYPQKNSIVIDSWAGFAEYGKNLKEKYNRKELILGLRKDTEVKPLLKQEEELCFVPVEQEERMPDSLIPFFKTLFPQLSLKEYFGAKNPDILNMELEGLGIKSSELKRLKKKYRLKASNPKPTVFEKIKEQTKKIFS